jgi:hypothetical protein
MSEMQVLQEHSPATTLVRASEKHGFRPPAAACGGAGTSRTGQLLGQDELVTVSHAQAVKTAAVLDQNFPRLAEELFGTQ